MRTTVYLVGAGPGDVGLLTVKGAEVLRRADVVVYDYLANPELLKLCPPAAKRVYVGKSAGRHTKTQEEIQAILVEVARSQKPEARREWVVVRLKGGDPYVFGRGGEEGEYLREHGVAFVEVPGVTAGIAAPAYAGIPVTHRDFASTVTFVTGHEREEPEARSQKPEKGGRVDFDALARLGGTIVFYMGVKSLPEIMQKLMAGGLDGTTPAAVIRWGTRENQRTVTGTVATIADVAKKAVITAPAITIVGKVVSLREKEGGLNWFERRPLFGKRVLVTRTRQQASELTSQLAELGAQVLEAQTIETVPPTDEQGGGVAQIDKQLMHLPTYDWVVFTSANGVRAAWERLQHLDFDARHFGASNVAAIGAATAEALKQIGISPDVVPEKSVGEELAAALKKRIGEEEMRGKRFLLLRADIARPALREELLKLGASVEDVAIYQTRRPERLQEEITAAIDRGGGGGELDGANYPTSGPGTTFGELLPPSHRK
ncbi:MAG: uroporphyrinogen-III C-methyltransferase, partial [Phycisphaerales bacterium]|nr:uroporphyrinogen-III C-methyltransferase [Phycisphaerales bacterium]